MYDLNKKLNLLKNKYSQKLTKDTQNKSIIEETLKKFFTDISFVQEIFFKNKNLIIKTKSKVWANEIFLKREEIQEEITKQSKENYKIVIY